jgi:streptogramin lyase
MRTALLRSILVLALLLPPAGASALEVVSLPDGTGVAALAVAADGTVWYTAQFSGGVGRVSPSGEVRLLGFPSRGTQPLGLAL